jgi:cation diffusion facilitator family transporter
LQTRHQNLRLQKIITAIAILLFVIKIIAWYLTNSVAILTDALESIVNVIAGLIGVYSLYVSAKPKDYDHPYGHGKAEFISAAVEGTLITVAGLIIIYEAVINLCWLPLRHSSIMVPERFVLKPELKTIRWH